jgi:hypothetical protein
VDVEVASHVKRLAERYEQTMKRGRNMNEKPSATL